MEITHRFGYHVDVDEAYRPLPSIYLAFLSVWLLSGFSWSFNTLRHRHFQTNKLQWTLASIPLLKALQLFMSYCFWYSCIKQQTCSLWTSFAAYITGILFQTASFVSFLLISHGYCIMCERLSAPERCTTVALGCVFYFTLVGYKASVPYFDVLLLLNYFVSFYAIFRYICQNLSLLREQLSFIEDEEVHVMHEAVYTKYTMFKKFQAAMVVVAVAEIVMYIDVESSSEHFWLRLLFREWTHFSILLYIAWTFKSQELAPHFFVMPTLKAKQEEVLPPIYSIEMEAMAFKEFSCHEWHIGVPTPYHDDSSKDSILVVVQHPHAQRPSSAIKNSPARAGLPSIAATTSLDSFPFRKQRNVYNEP
ncbi:hypothetical protein RJ641_024120 [Dillenia turbinata]|uniref:Transmembrane protein n=1 Tax=Dillenia turbinata TaxID=194707 RepID=A0AAN8UKS8_9MAGN